MAIRYLLLLSRQGKVRLAKWFETLASKEKTKIVREVTTLVLGRRAKIRYASLFFIAGIEADDNELATLEIIHRYVELMDKYYGNVCELDIIFNFQKAYYILDELLIAGEIQESAKREPLRRMAQQDALESAEIND
ncbi:hypothetical protein DV451_003031 [Geotrichum candidum]|uniref:AP complex subunit sigma n=1 Tax=Geotrichum candidum TaxID=1173061 RepID=A0A9P5KSX6_GEOCN|nr:hypothetical protein DV451_003031 [Geotrichum candidum]KAI9212654.1 hypothetical protein DS838_002455 [Geotrichum bryndzae]KAF5108574.1 hypothetical protein DV453_002167 [Geotrichum candidum]KAF5117424.1 hypothetical protein DV454_001093 [Geotrichum candidum]KAF5120021.1 hypothetical protein DV452_001341 [Geotrichum candidum]